MDFTTLDLHDLIAERNARQIMLIQSQSDAIAHLEHVVGAILLTMDTGTLSNVKGELNTIETLDPETQSVVQLYGEFSSDTSIKSQRETWKAELSDLETLIAAAEADGQTDE
jgi:hypothetical protein